MASFCFVLLIVTALLGICSAFRIMPDLSLPPATRVEENELENASVLGLTLDPCSTKGDCLGARNCIRRDASGICEPGDGGCLCAPPDHVICSSAGDCPAGETCARTILAPYICISSKRVETYAFYYSVIGQEEDNNLVPDCDKRPHNNPGLSGDMCTAGTCAPGRSCVTGSSTAKVICCVSTPCSCIPKVWASCKSSADCDVKERCVKTILAAPQCFSIKAIEAFSDEQLENIIYLD